jgi:hypothetical protein
MAKEEWGKLDELPGFTPDFDGFWGSKMHSIQ